MNCASCKFWSLSANRILGKCEKIKYSFNKDKIAMLDMCEACLYTEPNFGCKLFESKESSPVDKATKYIEVASESELLTKIRNKNQEIKEFLDFLCEMRKQDNVD